MSEKKLTDKQKLFCKYYLRDFNGSRAARDAGYSVKTADRIASENLGKPEIQKEIDKQRKNRNEAAGLEALDVVSELSKIGFIKDPTGIEGYSMEFDSKDKIKALVELGRHLGIFNNDESGKSTIKVTVGKPNK